MDEKLKPCPSCGSSRVRFNDGSGWSSCDNVECLLDGPHSDPTGAKWNALPRRTDAPAGMLDGELIARAIINGAGMLVATLLAGKPGAAALATAGAVDGEIIQAELDRRAAARKEAAK